MKKFSFTAALFAVPLWVSAQAIAPVTNNPAPAAPPPTPTVDTAHAPKIAAAQPNFDFGTVDEGPDIIHQFHIRNKGRGPLLITGVSTSCGCTAAVIEENGISKSPNTASPVTILGGGKGNIKATFHTSGRPGHSTKFITVTSNDPVAGSFQLKLDMTVVRDVDVQPDRLYLYGLKKGQPRSSTIKILGKPNMPLKILSAQSSTGAVTVTGLTPFEDTQEHRSGATIQVDLGAAQTIGNFTDTVVVKTDSEKKPEVDIAVLGEITGKVQYNPKSLYFAPHQDMPVTISFTADDPKHFAIRKVESAKHLVRPHIVKTAGPNGADQYLLVVQIVKDIPKESDGKDQVIVYTNDDEMGKISIDAQGNK